MPVILASSHFWAKGQLYLPGDDDSLVKIKFRGRFRRLRATERKDLDRRLFAGNLTPDVRAELEKRLAETSADLTDKQRAEIRANLDAQPISNEECLDIVLDGWDIKDANGEPLLYTPENRAAVFDELDGMPGALVRAWDQAEVNARNPATAEKNSGKQSGPSTPSLPLKR